MLMSQGTNTISTAPHSSQQNGLMENQFRTIFNAARVALAHSKLHKAFWSHAAQDAIVMAN